MVEGRFHARAGIKGYVLLSGIWWVLAVSWTWTAIHNPEANAWEAVWICAGAGTLVVAWLRGFSLTIEEGKLTYRNGLYRSRTVALFELTGEIHNVWKGRRFRTDLELKDGSRFALNFGPFSAGDLCELIRRIDAGTSPGRG